MQKEKQTKVKIYVSFLASDFDNLWLYMTSYESTDVIFIELRERMCDMYFYSQTIGYKVIHFIYMTSLFNEQALRDLLQILENDANDLVKPLVRKLTAAIFY